ncbi:MAG: ABC transporter ATP-binding protein, partial [Chthoniobacterales bacterium]
ALFLDDYNSFVALAPAVHAGRPTAPAPDGFATLALDHVSFAYPGTDRLALDDVSLEIRAGEVVALVGENGSGKTTLAKLLCHLELRGADARFRADELLERVGLADRGHHYPAQLSGGEQQRVALARAFFRGAPFLVLDEPTAALDPRAEHELFDRIRAMARGRTVLLISHRFSTVRH